MRHRPSRHDNFLDGPHLTATQPPTERLFSYGTLQLESVQMATFGRRLTGTSDALPGFVQAMLAIEDPAVASSLGQTHYAIARFTGRASDVVIGTVFDVTPDEIQSADEYEIDEYQRVAVTLQSGVLAWVYIDARDTRPLDSDSRSRREDI